MRFDRDNPQRLSDTRTDSLLLVAEAYRDGG
jgi:hypothetical protein